MRQLIFVSLLAVTMVWAEPSVYGSSSSGSAKKNRNSIISLQEEISQLKQEIEGLRSIVEGLSLTFNQIQQKEASSGTANSSGDAKLLQDLSAMIDKINSNYVSRVELQKVLKNGKLAKNSSKTKPPSTKDTKRDKKVENKLESAKSKDLYSRGVRLVKKKKYSMAKLRFDILKKRDYKKASTYFYLGEIAYRTKNYRDAIGYYKVSAEANENANYMDTLLLHTGISLEKTGDKAQSKRFFQAIIDGYPDTGSAKIAKKYL
ncbi:MAG: tetratricopeptide repeat protein [Sulfurovum sp.]|nr:tetratricopeptide repeat protein [Sulfurovum sp.]